MKKLYISKELIQIAKMILSYKYVYDKDHTHKPKGEGWHKTDKGWSNSELNPPGEKSLLKAFSNNPNFYEEGVRDCVYEAVANWITEMECEDEEEC